MVFGIIGENCSGKSTLAEKIKTELGAEIVNGAIRILVTADLETIKERFAERMHGTLPRPVALMLERRHVILIPGNTIIVLTEQQEMRMPFVKS